MQTECRAELSGFAQTKNGGGLTATLKTRPGQVVDENMSRTYTPTAGHQWHRTSYWSRFRLPALACFRAIESGNINILDLIPFLPRAHDW